MNHNYNDIRLRIVEEPTWWDEHAVPRYCDFEPRALADVYARKCALVLIECQQCRREFKVAFSWNGWGRELGGTGPGPTKESDIARLHYGDPPNVGCCSAGGTMTSIPRRVLEFWTQDEKAVWEWHRVPAFEVEIHCGWAELSSDSEAI